jgi:hypothetical protein
MFNSATSFNQNIGLWNISSVITMSDMFYNVVLPTNTYDNILNGWSSQSVQNNVQFSAGSSKYSRNGKVGRDILTGNYSWTITDGGCDGYCGAGSGTVEDPYQITTCTELQQINLNLSANYILMNDIDCSSYGAFTPIGTSPAPFVGTLDGEGNTISNIEVCLVFLMVIFLMLF